MDEEDRRKLFWYMKRKTSLTAWKALADAFDVFAEIFERQVQEQPRVSRPGAYPGSGTDWEGFYPEVLQAQVYCEQGLQRLAQGDRSVWLLNDIGVFNKADAIMDYWFTALINHGPHGDVFFEGKYVKDMEVAMADVARYSKVTSRVVQPVWDNPMAIEFWSKERKIILDREVSFPKNLPDVPLPEKEVRVRTGELVPCFGIFEPLVPDGCMNYLLAGVSAPQAVNVSEVDGRSIVRDVIWRLIWEDNRYLDGSIPPEEESYYPFFHPDAFDVPADVNVEVEIAHGSGEVAGKSGIWAMVDRLNIRRRFEIGDRLPEHEGREVKWIWVSKD